MNTHKLLLRIATLLILLSACAASRVKIGEINKNPGKYNEESVVVKGKVVNAFGLPALGQGIAKIDDGTGEIWVRPSTGVPFEGENVRIKGTVKIGLTIAGRNYGVIVVEDERPEGKE